MKKSVKFWVLIQTLVLSAAGAAAAVVDFTGATSDTPLLQIVAAEGVPAGLPSPAVEKGAFARINYEIREGFYGTNTMAAFDLASGARVIATKYGNSWKTEVEINGVKEAGKVETYQQKRYVFTSGASSIIIEVKNSAYVLTGDIAAELADGSTVRLDTKPKVLNEEVSFSFKNEVGDLLLRRQAVTGNTERPHLAAAVTALYLVMLRETPYNVYRSVDFTNASFRSDRGESEMVACSETGKTWQIKEDDYRTVKREGHEIYVCKFAVTWACKWKSCYTPYPHTQPGDCACQASCRDSAVNTGQCEWQAAE